MYNPIHNCGMKRKTNKAIQKQLDAKVLDIEFLLISVIQGVALAALAATAADPIGNFRFEYWLYVVSAFLLILNFWSQAIIHTLSFIGWPLDMTHNFFYFLVSLIEVMAFSHMTDPLKWFAFITLFFLVALILYFFDLQLIKKQKNTFSKTPSKQKLYAHIIRRELFELKILIPFGLLYNLTGALSIWFFPEVFIKNHFHLILVGIQVLAGLFVLLSATKNFQNRSVLLERVIN